MKPGEPLKLVSQLLDLPIIDRDGRWCGIVDDVEFSGAAGKETRVKALLVGPGAYQGRMPRWLYWLTSKIGGDRITRVPVERIAEIGAVVKLDRRAKDVGLGRGDDKAGRWIPRWGAL
jgi:sporulation protein YlmC with PRC-barrel domain